MSHYEMILVLNKIISVPNILAVYLAMDPLLAIQVLEERGSICSPELLSCGIAAGNYLCFLLYTICMQCWHQSPCGQ
jgi:hypothetical protein